MKRATLIALILCISLLLWGCRLADPIMLPVNFYYLHPGDSAVSGETDSILASETREASGHGNDLKYLLSIYLLGPSDTGLHSPFPSDWKLKEAGISGGSLTVTLEGSPDQLSSTELTLACACLTRTALGLTEAQSVQIILQEGRSEICLGPFTMESFLLSDGS